MRPEHGSGTGTEEPVVAARDVTVSFGDRRNPLIAVAGVDLEVPAGTTVALVGESGSGKSTLAMAMVRARTLASGRLFHRGTEVTSLPERRLRALRRDVQMVFQDPYSSLDPRMAVGDLIAEGLKAHRIGDREQRRVRVATLLEDVGLDPAAAKRRPAQFSGGQRQRIAIARALATDPGVVIADEPVSALDVSVQAQIVQLLQRIQEERGVGYLLVSHDLPLVHHLADRVSVMYLGRIVESGPVDEVVARPQHPYTAALLSAAPSIDARARRERIVLAGSPPSPIRRPTGCEFHPRCPIARDRCRHERPELTDVGAGHRMACFYPGELPGVLSLSSTRAQESQ